MKKTILKMPKDELLYLRSLLFISLTINFIVEVLNRDSFLKTLSSMIQKPHIFIYNAFIILVTLSITLLIKRRLVTCAFISILWITFGVTNNILLNFRTTPFTAVDISLASEAIPIMDKYLSRYQIIGIVVLAILVIVGLIFAFIKLPKHKEKLNYISNSIAFILILLVTISLTSIGMKTNILAKNFGNIGDAFKDYGFAYCFTNSLVNTGIDKPSNYSEETIQTIVDATEVAPEDANDAFVEPEVIVAEGEGKSPNIIFLQLESFFDPTHLEGVTFSEDPIPNFHKLQQKYTSGYLSVPSIGAGTANTEFEIITGMALDFFGPGEYPYKTILKQTTAESMPYNLKELGYSTHAIHNNTATFYGRNKVFTNLGFDSFVSSEYMKNISYNLLGWANDDVLTEEIMNVLNSTENTDYIYTISVQGHGKYPQDAQSLLEGAVSEGIDGDFKEDISTNEGIIPTNGDATTNTDVNSEQESTSSSIDQSTDLNTGVGTDVKQTQTTSLTGSEPASKDTSDSITQSDSVLLNSSSVVESSKDAKVSTSESSASHRRGNSSTSKETTDSNNVNYTIEHEITVNGIDQERSFAFEYYVNQIHEMDTFLGNLIASLEAYDEDVILVAYGDHLPSLGIEEEDLINGDMYQTEYIIWCSEGVIEGKHDRDLEAYQLSAYTLSLINQNPGLLTKLHQKELSGEFDATVDTLNIDIPIRDTITTVPPPVSEADVTSKDTGATSPDSSAENASIGDASSGNTSTEDMSSEKASTQDISEGTIAENAIEELGITYLDELELLQYDMLYGKQECYNNVNPYVPTKLVMGYSPITITSVVYDEASSITIVTGEHFTAHSKIQINGELIETSFVDHNTLTYKTEKLEPDSEICVAQVSDDEMILSSSNLYVIE